MRAAHGEGLSLGAEYQLAHTHRAELLDVFFRSQEEYDQAMSLIGDLRRIAKRADDERNKVIVELGFAQEQLRARRSTSFVDEFFSSVSKAFDSEEISLSKSEIAELMAGLDIFKKVLNNK